MAAAIREARLFEEGGHGGAAGRPLTAGLVPPQGRRYLATGFSLHSAKVALAVNWGIATVAYLAVAGLVARLLGRPRR